MTYTPDHYYLYAPDKTGRWYIYDIQHSHKAAEHMAKWGRLPSYYIAPACRLPEQRNA